MVATITAIPDRIEGSDQFEPTSFQDFLAGANAFYEQPEYLEKTRKDFAQDNRLPPNYTWNTQYKITRVAKSILSVVIFPVFLCNYIHSLVGRLVIPASTPRLLKCPPNLAKDCRTSIHLESEWKYKRVTIAVDGYEVDGMVIGKPSTLNNGRWVLASNGNCELYEYKLHHNWFRRFLEEIHGNAIVFNYPGVGASSGRPDRQAIAKAYRAVLTFLEDRKSGIGAKEIIGYGHSIGGGAQGDALNVHELKKEIKYVFIKSRTFSEISAVVTSIMSKAFGFLIKIFGWNMDCLQSSKKLKAPEIILQTAQVESCEELKDSLKIIGDGVIRAEAALAKALLDDQAVENKIFVGVPQKHNADLEDLPFLGKRIEMMLAQN